MIMNIMTREDGHKVESFNQDDIVSVAAAEKRFAELVGSGHTAWKPGVNGAPGEILKSFDDKADVVNFMPRLVGG